jgi:hypothetical protein
MRKNRSPSRKDAFVGSVVREKLRQSQSIPTREEFARAHAAMSEEIERCALLSRSVLDSLEHKTPVHDILFFGRPQKGFHAYVFYTAQSDVNKSRADGTNELIRTQIAEKVAHLYPDAPVDVTFDSHENVQRKCNGDYYKYLK